MMDKRNWTKIQIDILNDARIGRLPDNLWRLNIEIKLLADDKGFLPPEGDIAFCLRRGHSALSDDLKELGAVGLLDWVKEESDSWGRWLIPDFAESQGPVFVSPYPENWEVLRRAILLRDGNLCRYCGTDATHVDHIVPVTKGGTHEPENLVSACEHCNKSKGNRDLVVWYEKQPYFNQDRLNTINDVTLL
jgi:hypothetical protein